jgi:hypothetical protein
METYIRQAQDLEAVQGNFIPPLLDAILGDYNRNVPNARDAEVLNVMASITNKLQVHYDSVSVDLQMPNILLESPNTPGPCYT